MAKPNQFKSGYVGRPSGKRYRRYRSYRWMICLKVKYPKSHGSSCSSQNDNIDHKPIRGFTTKDQRFTAKAAWTKNEEQMLCTHHKRCFWTTGTTKILQYKPNSRWLVRICLPLHSNVTWLTRLNKYGKLNLISHHDSSWNPHWKKVNRWDFNHSQMGGVLLYNHITLW